MLLLLASAVAATPSALYFVLVDRFADGRPDAAGTTDRTDPQAWHGGDLSGLIDHLDEIPGDGLWISPIQKARTEPMNAWGAFHGYWTLSLDTVEPRLATEAELTELSTTLRASGKELWLDLVTNHVGYASPLVAAHPDWFHHNGDIKDWSDPTQTVTYDVHGLPDLAQENEAVYDYILQGALRWILLAHPTGFRIDAVRHLPVGFLKRLGRDLRQIDPKLLLLGEVIESDPSKLAKRQKDDQLDRVFDYPLRDALIDAVCKGDVGRLAATIGDDSVYANPSSLVTFLDNHDLPRVTSACGEAGAARALSLLLTLRGIPCITWGTEAALVGEAAPSNRADMVFAPQPLRPTIDALLTLRTSSDALGADAPTTVLEVNSDRVVLGRKSKHTTAALLLTNTPTSWSAVELGTGCNGWIVTNAEGPQKAQVYPIRLPAHSVGIVVCKGSPKGSIAARMTPHQPTRTVSINIPPGYRLVGSGPQLGSWNPEHSLIPKDGAVKLRVRAGTVLEYTLIKKNSTGWEWPTTKNTVTLVE